MIAASSSSLLICNMEFRELLEAKEAYERRFGPLSPDGESVRDGKFIWIAAPWPWQGEA